VVKESDTTVMLTSDTGMTEQLWQEAKAESHVEFIIAHVAFPGRLSHLALTTGHMTLALLDRIDTYGLHHIPFYISHMKSMFEREIRTEIKHAGRENLRVLRQGSILYASIFEPYGDKAYVNGFWLRKANGDANAVKVPIKCQQIINERGEWKWYGDQK
jgi:hypothetical protein